ncbi:MAG: C4-type zinc ribbon domain-containing protein [Verrucomicrobiae bacterium]|nr:C4-type zinc ribbon domain-containing protein [Verrucomicrobiae bacterium]MCX7722674.1 C4-type zinc ribbon domain-containing protein [Verrucomicrobiae bacterium]MDW7979268.1 C4-type zinc ribbon domain-containing protein [Verrucomicrobiales bacterium]
MLEAIERLLALQDCDRRIAQVRAELDQLEPQRAALRDKVAAAQAELDQAKTRVKQLESERKRLELEVESKKAQIERYSLQQFQTRKNEEYRALAHEIELCKQEIVKIEDRELELMEQIEATEKQIAAATKTLAETNRLVSDLLAGLDRREKELVSELEALQSSRVELAAAVAEPHRTRYERLFKSKGTNVVVGVEHSVCGGCHMRVPPQLLVQCMAQQEIVTCPNCGRILYYTRDMNVAVTD